MMRIDALRTVNPHATSYVRYRARESRAEAETALPNLAARWTALEHIAPVLAGAVLQAEDPRFFRHHGVDLAALTRKLAAAMRGRIGLVGASTLTQQLARNLYLTPARSFGRKLRELLLALGLDARLDKRRLLEIYLNVIEWGPDVWGASAASAHHFAKTPAALDVFESTFLASLIAAPRQPLSGRNAARSAYVQLRVSYQLLLAGLITPQDCASVTRRVREMHRRLAAGAALAEAMAGPFAAAEASEAVALADVCRALRITPIGPAEALARHYGCDQEQHAWRTLMRRVGQDALVQAVLHGNYTSLRPLVSGPDAGTV